MVVLLRSLFKNLHLHKDTFAKACLHQGFGNPAGSISSRAVHFCVVFSRKRTASVSSPASVRVHDDLAPSQTSITLHHD